MEELHKNCMLFFGRILGIGMVCSPGYSFFGKRAQMDNRTDNGNCDETLFFGKLSVRFLFEGGRVDGTILHL